MSPGVQVKEIPYFPNSAVYFAVIRQELYPVWLDSCQPNAERGRYDILAANPDTYLTTEGLTTRIETYAPVALGAPETRSRHPTSVITSQKDPLTLVEKHLPAAIPPLEADGEALPFAGGAIGYLGYDLGRRFEVFPNTRQDSSGLADMVIGIYSWAIVVDHVRQKTFLSDLNIQQIDALSRQINGQLKLKSILEVESIPFNINNFEHNLNKVDYFEKFDRIQKYIHEGDVYQVNFAQRFTADYRGNPLAAYLHLRKINPAPFAGFIPLKKGALLSLSPERFIQASGNRVTTSPIKGTAPRSADPAEDQALAKALQGSSKNRAENLMIVDLLRNDLSRNCHQVEVPSLFELQSFPNVHHLVSTITATLNPDSSALDLLRSAFPGGSITGAPKIRAMEIIDASETHERGPYCGSLLYISRSGHMDSNIAIRTLAADADKLYCWGGGGIVADSTAAEEYEESLTKVSILMKALEARFLKKV